ncbi:MAG TPA: alpha/beta hydrolase-fold protein [Sphingomicrobium sp.]|nr:alpha/beta hydrolase-fold protein [Sphingomicrobium sp.]
MRNRIIGVALLGASPAALHAQQAAPIAIGETHAVQSRALGETRNVNVVLPAGYAKNRAKRYPVVYLIDGGVDQDLLHVSGVAHLGALWGRSQEAIVVGIETKDRRRELVGPTRDPELLKKYPTAGSSNAFRGYIRDEVKPLIERTYRITGDDAVLGESLAGLFVIETMLEEPALFDAFAAIDPSLWWDKEALSRAAARKGPLALQGKRVFIARAKEQSEEPAPMDRMLSVIRRSGAAWCFSDRTDLFHSTIYQQVSPQAFQFILPPAEAPPADFHFEVQCSAKS